MADKRIVYTDKQLDFVKILLATNEKLSIPKATRRMCEKFDIEYSDSVRRAISNRVNKEVTELKKKKHKIELSDEFLKARQKVHDSTKETFIVSWAQNATPVHSGFLNNIEAYAGHLNAGVHIIAGRYKNPTSVFEDREHEQWDEPVRKYLDANRHNLHELLQVLSDVKISPTASTPLSGLNGISGLESCIVGHPRQHLKSLPVLEGYPSKLLLSTGACTVDNYTDSKAGKKGSFHHTLGFVIIELDGDCFHIRQVSADRNGNFYDLFKRVKNGKVTDNEEGCEAAVLGDIHIQHNDKEATKTAFELLDRMKPKHTMIHDIIDCESISHHDSKNPFRLLEKEESGADNLGKEIDEAMKWLKKRAHHNLVVVRSNHDDFLDRWLMYSDWRKVSNKKLYLKLANVLATEPKAQLKGVIPFLIEKETKGKVKTLSLDDSYRVLGWELAMHGHIGASGSRGSHTQFKVMNTKNITAHVHHPHREDGHVSVGTLTKLRVGYNRGLSNWMHTLSLIYPDGKAQLIHIIKNKYCR